MKKIILLSCIAYLFSFNCFSQWKWSHPQPQGNELHTITYASPSIAFAAGDFGTIMKSTDGGITWSVIKVNRDGDIYGLQFLSPSIGFAFGNCDVSKYDHKQFLLRTMNGGEQWDTLFLDYFEDFEDICFTSISKGFVVANDYLNWYGILKKTTDAGKTWEDQWYPGTIKDILFTDSLTGFFLSSDMLYKTSDGGTSWIVQLSGLNYSSTYKTRIVFPSSDTGYLFPYGSIYKSTDKGNSWSVIVDSVRNVIKDISFPKNNIGFISTTQNVLLKTIDGGFTWDTACSEFYKTSVTFINEYDGLSIDQSNSAGTEIDRTFDSGKTWEAMTTNVSRCWFMSCDFPSANVGFVAGIYPSAHPDFLKTNDGGIHWNTIFDTAFFDKGIAGISFPDENNGYLLKYPGNIYRTDNQGATWQLMYSSSETNSGFINFFNKNEGVAGLTNAYNQQKINHFLKTSDGGITWATIEFNMTYTLRDFSFPSHDTGIMISSKYGIVSSQIYRTVNGGSTWDTVSTLPGIGLKKVFFLDGTVGYATTSDSLYKTLDGGSTWKVLNLNYGFYLENLWFFNENEGIVVGSGGMISLTKDGGATWTSIESGTNLKLYTISFPTHDSGYIAGENGIILSISNATHLGIPKPIVIQKTSSSVFYPNPSNGNASIRFRLQNEGSVKVVIYDLMGKEVKSILVPSAMPGENTVSFSASGLPSGLYYYRLIAGDQIESGKFVRQ